MDTARQTMSWSIIIRLQKKDEISPSATIWIDLEGIMLSEISQRKTKAKLYNLTYMWNLKKQTSSCHR